MQTITVNLAAKAKRVVHDGHEYLVAPLTLIVPGVLSGNNGPVYYPAEENVKSAGLWDGMPITVYHPTANGNFVSAQYPGILEASGIGFLANSRTDENGVLKAEGWFDAGRTREVDARVHSALVNGQRMELSTGLGVDLEVAVANAVDAKGRPYAVIARNYRPDHLAVLPDQRGACSLNDGCGVLVNQYACRCGGTCSTCAVTAAWHESAPALSAVNWDSGWSALLVNPRGKWTPPPAGNAPKAVKDILRKVYSKYRDEHPAEDTKIKTAGAKIAWAAVKSAGWKKNKSGRWVKNEEDVVAEHTGTVGGWSELRPVVNYDISLQDRYRQLERMIGEMSGGMAYLTDVYDTYIIYNWRGKTYRLDYTEQGGTCVLSEGDPVEVERMTVYEPVNNASGDTGMALNPQQRAEIINDLTTNCGCWKQHGDRDILNGFSDDKLVQLKEHADRERKAVDVANTAVHGFSDGKSAYRVNPETGKWEHRPLEQQPAPTTNGNGQQPPANKPVHNHDNGQHQDPPAPPPPAPQPQQRPTNNNRPQTMEEWVRSAPVEVQNTFRYAKSIEDREKDALISKLLINVSETERPAHRERLQRRSLEDLHNDLALVPKVQAVEQPTQPQQPNRRQATNRTSEEVSDMLTVPVINWQEVKGTDQSDVGQLSVQNGAGNFTEPDTTDDDWLRTAPASVRSRVMNALVIEERERRKLIDELTANMTDDEAQQRLANRLEKKSIDELKDLLTLRPKSEPPRANYFGSSAAPVNNAARPNERTEDILPLPAINWADDNRRRQA